MENVKVLFVEDYKDMSKEEFSEYIKKIYNEGYNDGYAKGKESCTLNAWGTIRSTPNVQDFYYTTTNAVSNTEI